MEKRKNRIVSRLIAAILSAGMLCTSVPVSFAETDLAADTVGMEENDGFVAEDSEEEIELPNDEDAVNGGDFADFDEGGINEDEEEPITEEEENPEMDVPAIGDAASEDIGEEIEENEGILQEDEEDQGTLVETGYCGNGETVVWEWYDSGLLKISGNGEMNNYSGSNQPWYKYKDSIKKVVIGYGVTSIGNYAFYNCSNLSNIEIPESVTKIKLEAFGYCTGLADIRLPKNIMDIEHWTFLGCSSLKSVYIEDLVSYLNINFGNDYSSPCYSGGGNLYLNDELLEELDIPEGVTSIKQLVFKGCKNIKSVKLPESITSIGSSAFEGCSNLKSVYIEDLASYLNINFSNGYANPCYYAGGSLYLKGELLEEAEIPEGVTSIKSYAFYNCKSIKSVKLPESITIMGSSAFRGCSNLKSVKMLDSVTSIGSYAFAECSSLDSVNIPNGVMSIESCAFEGCSNLKSVKLPDSVTSIGSYAFNRCSSLNSINIPDSVTSMGVCVFYNCSSLSDVNIPEGVTSIGSYAFYGCKSMTSIQLPSSVTSIGNNAFDQCTNLTDVTVPEKCTVNSNAFRGCSKLNLKMSSDALYKNEMEYNGHTYALLYNNIGLSWDALERYCENMGGHLAAITSEEENTAVFNFLSQNGVSEAYFGGTDEEEEGNWKWVTGEEWDYTNWHSGEPNNSYGNEDYTIYSTNADTWNDNNGTGTYYAVCEWEYIDTDYNLVGIIEYNEHTYSIYDCRSDWAKANNICTRMNGHLVTITSEDEQKAVEQLLDKGSKNNYWLGGLKDESGVWSWVTGEEMTYAHWAYGQPNNYNNNENRLSVYNRDNPSDSRQKRFYWNDVKYDATVNSESFFGAKNFGFICEWDGTTVPVTPVTIKIGSIGANAVRIDWAKITGENDIAEYNVYRNNEKVGTTSECSYTDLGLEEGTSYTYTVEAVDKSGNVSPKSNAVTAVPKASVITSVNPADGSEIGGSSTVIKVMYSNNNNLNRSGMSLSAFYSKDGQDWTQINSVSEAYKNSSTENYFNVDFDMSSIGEGQYKLKFILTDISNKSDEVEVTYNIDAQAPGKIKDVVAVSEQKKIILSWKTGTEADVSGYNVYRSLSEYENYKLIASVSGRDNTTYTDTNVVLGTKYYYKISAYDKYNQEGEMSSVAFAVPQNDITPPNVLTITPKKNTALSKTARISVTASDNNAVKGIKLQYSADGKDWTDYQDKLTSQNAGFDFDTTKFSDGVIYIRAIAYDYAGNQSNGNPVYTYVIDNTGPAKVENVQLAAVSASTATLSWGEPKDEDFAYFLVEQLNAAGNYVQVGKTDKTLGINIYNLTPGTSYTYIVTAYDVCGNRGVSSDPIVVKTPDDETAPVITAIRPKPARFSSYIDMTVNAEDNAAVKSVRFETSTDKVTWVTEGTVNSDSPKNSESFKYRINLANKKEGSLFVRPVAVDTSGNESDKSESAPFSEYIVDKTAPAAPQNVEAVPHDGYMEIKWVQGSEEDLNLYSVYRSEEENGEYECIKSGLAAINCNDASAEAGKTYYYKVCVNDTAGNVSEFSKIVSGTILEDKTKPIVHSISPASGTINKSKPIGVLASDNNILKRVILEYSTDNSNYSVFGETNANGATDGIFEFKLGDIPDGRYYFRAYAEDNNSNISDYSAVTEYVIDTAAPVVSDINLELQSGSINIKWTSENESDLSGFYIYKKVNDEDFKKLGSVSDKDITEYEFSDKDINKLSRYTYKIEAVDYQGNKAEYVSKEIYITGDDARFDDTEAPTAVISAPSNVEVGVENYFDASLSEDNVGIVSYLWDFGDGTTSTKEKAVHKYDNVGEYTVRLTVTDGDNNSSSKELKVSVYEKNNMGKVNIKVINTDGEKLSGAGVFFNFGSENVEKYMTSYNGTVSINSAEGTYTIGVYMDGYLPVKQDVRIYGGGNTTDITVSLEKKEIVTGELTHKKMTLEEIKAAGIDLSKPENQNVYEYTVNLVYGGYEFKSKGYTTEPDKPIRVEVPENSPVDGSTTDIMLWITKGTSLIAVLEIPEKTSWLKEFYDVQLDVYNQSGEEFSLDDCKAVLNFDSDGMSIVSDASDNYSSSETVNMGTINGQEHKYVNWILRGDKEGSYDISADFSGTLRDFNEDINVTFDSSTPIKVYGGEGLKQKIQLDDNIDNGYVYFAVGFANERNEDVPLIGMDIPGVEAVCEKLQTGDNIKDVEKSDEIKVIKPQETYWKYYSIPYDKFEVYLKSGVNWNSGISNVRTILTDFYVNRKKGVEIPVEFTVVSDYLFRNYPESLNNSLYEKLYEASIHEINSSLGIVGGGLSAAALTKYAMDNDIDVVYGNIIEEIGKVFNFDINGKLEKLLNSMAYNSLSTITGSKTEMRGITDQFFNYMETAKLLGEGLTEEKINRIVDETGGIYTRDEVLAVFNTTSINRSKFEEKSVTAEQAAAAAILVGSASDIVIENLENNTNKFSKLRETYGDIRRSLKKGINTYFASDEGIDLIADLANYWFNDSICDPIELGEKIGTASISLVSSALEHNYTNAENSDILNALITSVNTNIYRQGMQNKVNTFTQYSAEGKYPSRAKMAAEISDYASSYEAANSAIKSALESSKNFAQKISPIYSFRAKKIESLLDKWNMLSYEAYKENCIKEAQSRYSDSFDYNAENGRVIISGLKSQTKTLSLDDEVSLMDDKSENVMTYIPGTVNGESVSIGEGAFENNSEIEMVVIGDGVKSIGAKAFKNCKSLNTVIIGEGLESIDESAFEGCTSLTNVMLPENLSSIGANAFKNCTELYDIEIPSNTGIIGANAFNGDTSLTEVKIVNKNAQIGASAFVNCSDSLKLIINEDGNVKDYAELNNISHEKITPEITSIKVSELPKSTEVGQGLLPDTEGMELTVSYDDGTEEVVDNGWAVYCDNKELGDTKVIVFYRDKQTEYDAKVVPSQGLKITFAGGDGASGTAPEAISASKNGKITLPTNTFTKEKYKFAGWKTAVNGKNIFLPEGAEYVPQTDTEFTAVWVDIRMNGGASVRMVTPTGLRFAATVDTAGYNAVKELDSNAACGTVICPADYIGSDEFTMNALDENNKKYLNIESKGFAVENDLAKEFRSVISNVKEMNFERLFAGRGYIKYTYTNGEENIIYTDFNAKNNERTISGVAKAALEDTSVKYTEEQKNVLQSFLKE